MLSIIYGWVFIIILCIIYGLEIHWALPARFRIPFGILSRNAALPEPLARGGERATGVIIVDFIDVVIDVSVTTADSIITILNIFRG